MHGHTDELTATDDELIRIGDSMCRSKAATCVEERMKGGQLTRVFRLKKWVVPAILRFSELNV
jgi:hypothetical protein